MKTVEITELFSYEYGNQLDLNKMAQVNVNNDAVAFIGRTGSNNGVVAYVAPIDAVEPYTSGRITVALGGTALASFIQFIRFYTAQNIVVLQPHLEMTVAVKLYYCLCIEANRYRYSTFGREANRTLRTLRVPAPESIPSWVLFLFFNKQVLSLNLK